MKYNLEEAYALKSVVEKLFGREAWYEIKHATSEITWRKYSKKILSAVLKAAQSTIQVADNDWFERLEELVSLGHSRIDNAKSIESIFGALSGTLAQINFHQIGFMPNHGNKKRVTLRHSCNWRLSKFRSVLYVQSESQKSEWKAYHQNNVNGEE